MTDRHKELKGVQIVHMHTEGTAPYADPKYAESFYVNNMFVATNLRKSVQVKLYFS